MPYWHAHIYASTFPNRSSSCCSITRNVQRQPVCRHHPSEPLDDRRHGIRERPRLPARSGSCKTRSSRTDSARTSSRCPPANRAGARRRRDGGVEGADELRAGRRGYLDALGVRIELAHQHEDALLPDWRERPSTIGPVPHEICRVRIWPRLRPSVAGSRQAQRVDEVQDLVRREPPVTRPGSGHAGEVEDSLVRLKPLDGQPEPPSLPATPGPGEFAVDEVACPWP